jgi:hypothetical protein
MALEQKIKEVLESKMLHPDFDRIDLGLQGNTTKINLEKAMDLRNNQSKSEQSATSKLFEPFKKSLKRSVSCIDSGNTSYGAPANNTFSLNRRNITQPFEKWKQSAGVHGCLWFPESIIKQRKERGGFVAGDLIFAIKNYKGEKHRVAGLFVSLPEINRAFNIYNNNNAYDTNCKQPACPVCPSQNKNQKLNLTKLTANFHPVGIVMEEYRRPDEDHKRSSQTNPYTIATDGEIPVHDYWRSLQIDPKSNVSDFELKNNRKLDLRRTNKMAHAAGESLFLGFSHHNGKLYFQPVTGKTLECLLSQNRNKSEGLPSFWAIGRIVNPSSDKQITKFSAAGIMSNGGEEISSTSPLYGQTFATISLHIGLLLPEK